MWIIFIAEVNVNSQKPQWLLFFFQLKSMCSRVKTGADPEFMERGFIYIKVCVGGGGGGGGGGRGVRFADLTHFS